jgi:hypothetical protein
MNINIGIPRISKGIETFAMKEEFLNIILNIINGKIV